MTQKQKDRLAKQLANLSEQEKADLLADKSHLKRKDYEDSRNQVVDTIVDSAQTLSDLLKDAKERFYRDIEAFRKKAEEYSGTEGKESKGNMTLTHSNGLHRVEYAVQENFSYDERADQAEILIREYLSNMVKGENKVVYDLVASLLERKINGKLDTRQVAKLYKYEAEIADAGFKKAIALFKEAYKSEGSTSYIRVYTRLNLQAQWEQLPLNFASI